jgi:hypothetical protein
MNILYKRLQAAKNRCRDFVDVIFECQLFIDDEEGADLVKMIDKKSRDAFAVPDFQREDGKRGQYIWVQSSHTVWFFYNGSGLDFNIVGHRPLEVETRPMTSSTAMPWFKLDTVTMRAFEKHNNNKLIRMLKLYRERVRDQINKEREKVKAQEEELGEFLFAVDEATVDEAPHDGA